MTRPSGHDAPEQFDLFLPYLSDLPMREQREMRERPFFSLAKSKRTRPIGYRGPDGQVWSMFRPIPITAWPRSGTPTS